MSTWEYGGAYKNHDMDGPIPLPNQSMVQVCDLTKELPEFMKDADVLFIDPPCSKGNIQSFYTKADLGAAVEYGRFSDMLFDHIAAIRPRHLFLELFASNVAEYTDRALRLFSHHIIHSSFYYKKRSNRCWILHFSNEPISLLRDFDDLDEEYFIKKLCHEFDYECIGDLCMGTGLVGKYAYQAGKKFVGTELNKKRLALLVDHIKTSEAKK